MGLRNATVRQLRVADVTTTVLTLTLTGLAADSSVAGGSNPRPARRIFSIIALFVGALSGAYLLRYGVALPLFITGACVLLTTATYAATPQPQLKSNALGQAELDFQLPSLKLPLTFAPARANPAQTDIQESTTNLPARSFLLTQPL
jgi:hypothetical protein